MAIILRQNTATNTGKGSKLTFTEMDNNLESFFYSSSFSGNILTLFTTGSVSHSINLASIAAGVNTGSLLLSASYNGQVITFTKANNSTFTLNLGEVVTELESGSLITSAIYASETITFERGDGTTFDLDISDLVTELESGSLLRTSSLSGGVMTFTKGDGTTYGLNLNSLSGSGLVTASVADNIITFTKGDNTTFNVLVNNVPNAISASYAATASRAVTASTASYALSTDGFRVDGSHDFSTATNVKVLGFVGATAFQVDSTTALMTIVSSSYATTASFAIKNVETGSYNSATNTLTLVKGDGTSFNVNLTSAGDAKIAVTDTSTNQNYYLTFVEGTSGEQDLRVDSAAVVYNPSTNTLQTENLLLTGDLTVQGTRTELQVTDLRVEDKLITVASGSANSAAADGAGIEIAGANQSITWDSANSRFKTSTTLAVSGSLNLSTLATDEALSDFVVVAGDGTLKKRTSGAQGIQGTQGTQGTQGIQGVQGTTGIGTQGIQGITGTATQGTQGTQGTTGSATQGIQGITGTQGTQGTTGSATQGIQGITGTQGTQGTTGTATQGIQGVQGITGTQGTNGTNGTNGTQGIQGITGTQGIQGITGAQGTDGTNGTQGIQGITGAQGIQGTTGTGTQGIQGITGTQGTTGSGTQGIQGITGTQGTQGTTGTGTQGIQGITGSDSTVPGPQGIQGIQGVAGGASSQGIQGIQGTTGTGTQGIQGITGTQGTQGTTGTGTQGIQGITGAQGTTGSGTQGIQGITGTQGTAGSATQGIQGITGAQGIQGITGTGTQGTQGTTGSATQGIQGIQGITGAQGADGTNGTNGTQGIQGIQGTTGTGAQGVSGAEAVTLYNSNGSLVDTRTVNFNGYDLTFYTVNDEKFIIDADDNEGTDLVDVRFKFLPEPGESLNRVIGYDVTTGKLYQQAGATAGSQGVQGTQGPSGTGTGLTLNNNTNNYVITATGTTALNGESDLTFTPSTGFGTQNWLDIDNGGLSFGDGTVYEGYFNINCVYNSSNTALTIPRDTYNAIFIEYTYYDPADLNPMRTSNFVSHWNSSTITYTNHGTTDIGTIAFTSALNYDILRSSISSSNVLITMYNSIVSGGMRLVGRYRLFRKYVAA